jgi:altronate dehydratase
MNSFEGYSTADGKAGTRNYVLVIPSVGCSQGAAQAIARGIKGAVFLPNILGCGQIGEDQAIVKRTLVGFGTNPMNNREGWRVQFEDPNVVPAPSSSSDARVRSGPSVVE